MIKKIVSILSALRPHDWEILNHAKYESLQQEQLGCPVRPARRRCKRTGRTQIAHEHVLGLNPPEKIYYWEDENPTTH